MNDIDFQKASLKKHSALGSGVWGTVYDLGDGTVLKIAKEIGGIGNGNEKVRHERKMMEHLAGQDCPYGLPDSIGYGDIPENSDLKQEGYTVWLRSTKLSGRVLKIKEIETFPTERQQAIATALGAALAAFHKTLDQTNLAEQLKPDNLFNTLDNEGLELTQADHERMETALSYLRPHIGGDLRPIHGDFNISNILFDDRDQVSGVLDFAEMCLGTAEDDICSLTSELPFLRENIIRQYETDMGISLDRQKLVLAEMKRDLIGMLICRYRLDRPEEALADQNELDRALAKLSKSSVSSTPSMVK